ncbi:hypothetical protein CC2G_003228 [Coprinopsis cinerea AmutBmut pab1-1]|nr:hypothetical protein CC2G_003228 [Coprinopsis cinerea AmutBmut pab1-1]
MGDNSLPGDSIEAADFAGLTLSEPGMTRERKHADIQLEDPVCHGMEEVPGATEKRSRVLAYLRNLGSKWEDSGKEDLDSYLLDSEEPPDRERDPEGLVDSGSSSKGAVTEEGEGDEDRLPLDPTSPLFKHLEQGLALTVGSALGSTAPSVEECLVAFQVPNKANLTAGARA